MTGSRHWRNQRISAVALVPLGVWFLYALLSRPDLAHASVVAWLADPWQAGLMLLFGWCALWHSAQGIQVVVDDYVPAQLHGRARLASRLLHAALALILAAAIGVIAMAGNT
ncbi:MAG: succinate dehydrogenase, hydrophobic membrane anchor protein [Steroidobacteraceae bacterium]